MLPVQNKTKHRKIVLGACLLSEANSLALYWPEK